MYKSSLAHLAVNLPHKSNGACFSKRRKGGDDAVNKQGGNVTVVHLPEISVRGNTHFPMSDLNNLEIAYLMSSFLRKKGLDQ
jgi:hypothetical protein